MNCKRLNAIVHGRVQGVNFRWHTHQEANRLGVTGWVSNLNSGRSVQVVAEGTPEQLGLLLAFLHQGPAMARVDDVEINWETATGEFSNFGVRYL